MSKRQPIRNIPRPSKKQYVKTSFNLKNDKDEDISSGDEDDNASNDEIDSNELQDAESADVMRKRLAKEYLAQLDASDSENSDDEDDGISDKLKKNRLEQAGKYYKKIADSLNVKNISTVVMNSHKSSITCIAVSGDEKKIVSGSKDNSLILWNIANNSRQVLIPQWSKNPEFVQSHEGEILCVAISTDGRYIASGGRDKTIRIFDGNKNYEEIAPFKHHRDTVSCLCFKRDSYTLFSGSYDRCLKHWDLNEMGYVETLYGHQDIVNSMDCWVSARPITGSNDRTVRIWKVAEESHSIFRGHKGNIDNVQYLTEDTFISGGQDGNLFYWKDKQKHPIATYPLAHGKDECGIPRWITAISCIKMSDLVITGSYDGFIRIWKIDADTRTITPINTIEMGGFVNSLVVTNNMIVIGSGKEHKLGRWWNIKGNHNKVTVKYFETPLTESL